MRFTSLATCLTLACLVAACGDSSTNSDDNNSGGSTSSNNDGGGRGNGNPGNGGAGAGSSGEPAELDGMTAEHNEARANVSPAAATPLPPLTWDPAIAAVAQAYSENCVFEHSNGRYGENLYANYGSNASPADVVGGWVSEVEFYDYASNSCQPNEICGHYTQVVWADSLRLGCGVATCTQNSPFGNNEPWQNWVCNYDPPGNWVGEKPY
jgi:pathogenesis-related protein 1